MKDGSGAHVKKLQPFLRWAGSKRQLVPILSTYWRPGFKRYVEPFAGSACLFFRLAPSKAILGDLNEELIETYKQVKYNLPRLISHLRKLPNDRYNYMRLRGMDPSSLTAAFRAARFIYLNRFCFNGLHRTNRLGKFNVPYGGEKSGEIPPASVLHTCSKLLRRARLVAGDFETVLKLVQPGDFVYLDPPFSVKARRVFNEYDSSGFDTEDLVRLREWLERLSEMRVPFVVSYAECEESEYLARGFRVAIVSVRRNIAGFASRRSNVEELIISNGC